MKKNNRSLRKKLISIFVILAIFASLPGVFTLIKADEKIVDVDMGKFNNWLVYDHYDVMNGGYDSSDEIFTKNRPYYPVKENQAVKTKLITIPELLENGQWKNVHHIKEHIYPIEALVETDGVFEKKSDLVFMGYGEYGYTDWALYPSQSKGEKTIDYDVYANKVDTHTLSSAGFLINAGIDEDGYIHGYVLSIQFSKNSFEGAGMFLYKIKDGIKASDLHHVDNGGFTAGNYVNIPVMVQARDIAVDGEKVLFIDNNGDGIPDYVAFYNVEDYDSNPVGEGVMEAYYENGETGGAALFYIDDSKIYIDENGIVRLFENEQPISLESDRLSIMEMPMSFYANDPEMTVSGSMMVNGEVKMLENGETFLGNNGVYTKENMVEYRANNNAHIEFLSGRVSIDGTEYPIGHQGEEIPCAYIQSNYVAANTASGGMEYYHYNGHEISFSADTVVEYCFYNDYDYATGTYIKKQTTLDRIYAWVETAPNYQGDTEKYIHLKVLAGSDFNYRYSVGRPGENWYETQFVPNESSVVLRGKSYVLDNVNNYIQSGSLYLKSDKIPGNYYISTKNNMYSNNVYIEGQAVINGDVENPITLDGENNYVVYGYIYTDNGMGYYPLSEDNYLLPGCKAVFTIPNSKHPDSVEIDGINAYMQKSNNNYVFINESPYNSFGQSDWQIISATVVLNGVPMEFDNGNMWFNNNDLWVRNSSTGVISTYYMDETNNYIESGQVRLNRGDNSSGIEKGVYKLGEDSYMQNGYLYIKAQHAYASYNIDGIDCYVEDGSQFIINDGRHSEPVSIDGMKYKFEGGNFVLCNEPYFSLKNWNETDTYPIELEFKKEGNTYVYTKDVNGDISWSYNNGFGLLTEIYVIDDVNLFLPDGETIYVDSEGLHVLPDGVLKDSPYFSMYDAGGSYSWHDMAYHLDGIQNYQIDENTAHIGEHTQNNFHYNQSIAELVGRVNNAAEVFDPDGQRTSALHFNIGFNDDSLVVKTNSIGNEENVITAIFDENDGLMSENEGEYYGYGPYVEYQSHSCNSLTSFNFSGMILSEAPTYMLHFDKNSAEATDGSFTSKTVTWGISVGELPKPVRPDYKLVGWAEVSNAEEPDFDEKSAVKEDGKTVYAVWKYAKVQAVDVNFMINYNMADDIHYTVGEAANNNFDNKKHLGDFLTLFEEPVRKHYIFLGWYDTRSGGARWDFNEDKINEENELTLYAQWEAIQYTVILNSGNGAGEEITLNMLAENDLISLENDFTGGENKFLTGFSKDSEAENTDYNGSSFVLTPNELEYLFKEDLTIVTLYAIWDDFPNNSRVIYNSNGASGNVPEDEREYYNGETVTLLGEADVLKMRKIGYTFLGWSFESGYNNDSIIIDSFVVDKEAMSDENGLINLYAVWVEEKSFDIIFNANGGVGNDVERKNVGIGDIVYLPSGEEKFKHFGNELVGYSLTGGDGANNVYSSDFLVDTERLSELFSSSQTAYLYAVWEAKSNIMLMFDKNGGTDGNVMDKTVTFGENAGSLPTKENGNAPKRNGYDFMGWSTDNGSNAVNFFEATKVDWNDTKTVYAVWQAVFATTTTPTAFAAALPRVTRAPSTSAVSTLTPTTVEIMMSTIEPSVVETPHSTELPSEYPIETQTEVPIETSLETIPDVMEFTPEPSVVSETITPSSAILLSNGFFAVEAEENLFQIYDENGTPLGYIRVPEGDDIENMDIEANLIPLSDVAIDSTGEVEAIKGNPVTGEF